jgi:KaiC/GvpD/RAD55 family RecA-like ATPase
LTLYYNVIKAFLDPSVYTKYQSVIDQKYLKENYPETYRVYQSLAHLQSEQQQSTAYAVDDLALRFFTDYPNASANEYGRIFESIRSAEAQPDSVRSYLNALLDRARATRIAETALAVASGTTTFGELATLIASDPNQELSEPDGQDELVVTDDLDELYALDFATNGLRWRLDSLNKALGSLRKGDFGFVFARPETGKTTLLASEATHMASQTTGDILWFNNEEQERKVQERCYQAALGLDRVSLFARRPINKARYTELTGNRIKIIKAGGMSFKDIERTLARYNPALIIFDQIDKITGFQEDRNDLELKAIYVWAREIAKKYAPVIAVCQAGGSGENKRWLTMNDVDNSKTGKQGEADWILGVGKVHDEGLESVRYLQLSKNKLPGDSDTDPGLRHGQWEVKINPTIARYEDWT